MVSMDRMDIVGRHEPPGRDVERHARHLSDLKAHLSTAECCYGRARPSMSRFCDDPTDSDRFFGAQTGRCRRLAGCMSASGPSVCTRCLTLILCFATKAWGFSKMLLDSHSDCMTEN